MEPLGNGDPKRIGPYRLRARLGAGAMGQVYLGEARDKRQAAMKLLRAEFASSPEYRERFAREFAAARSVTGPHTAPVFDADPQAARPWFASAYVPGPTLQEHVAAHGPFDAATTAALGSGLVAGFQAIHVKGLVHRDLKPRNVIIAVHGPVIIDFGVSRAIDASTLTATGTILGTYGYMAPEQITADTATPASDVFALGCALAFAATGKGPFDASTVAAVIHRVVAEAPELGGLEGELRKVVEACLAKDPATRPVVHELMACFSTLAGGTGAPTRIDTAAGVFTGSGFATGRVDAATEVQGRTFVEPFQPGTSGRRAERGRRRLLNRRNLLIGSGGLAAAAAGPTGWLAWTRRHQVTSESAEDISFSKDGRYFAATHAGNGWVGGWIWDAETKDIVAEFTGGDSFLVFSPDSTTVVNGDLLDPPITFRDAATGGVLRQFDSPYGFTSCTAFSPDGTRLAVGGSPHSEQPACTMLDVETGKQIEVLPASGTEIQWVTSLAFVDDGTLVLVGNNRGSDDELVGSCWRWDFGSGELSQFGTSGGWYEITVSEEGRIAVCGDDGCLLSLDADETDLLQLIDTDTHAVAFSSDGTTLATADDDAVRLWDVETSLEQSIIGKAGCTNLAFSPDGTHLAMASSTAGLTGCWLWPID